MITHTNTSRYPREASGGMSDGVATFIKGGIQQFQVEVIQQYRAFLLFKMSLLPRFNLVGNKYKVCTSLNPLPNAEVCVFDGYILQNYNCKLHF
jgi:hypothetical protein